MTETSTMTTRFLYVTDLHGDSRAYAALPDLCENHDLAIIIQGGDMLPKSGDMFEAQRRFLDRELPACLDRCAERGITFFGLFGNDDLKGVHDLWLDLTHSRQGVHDLEERWHVLPDDVIIRGCSWVPDYPFGLKDWCLRDSPTAAPVLTRGRSVVTTPTGMETIPDPGVFFAARPTLEEHLDSLVAGALSMERAIMVSHAPPAGLGLGRLWNGVDVGSASVHRWVARHQPLLTLSGHIHESPEVGIALDGSPRHTGKIGRTTSHQPGQVLPGIMTYSVIGISAAGEVEIDWRSHSLRR